jgi:SAM-dependent methyltransferase
MGEIARRDPRGGAVVTDIEESFAINKARWSEVVEIHARSPFYRVPQFLKGEDVLYPIESAEIGPLQGKRLVHLQCHLGLDTLCLARRGAIATGLDFSPQAIAKAEELSRASGIPARFVEGNVYDTPKLIAERFDVVYVTWGAICWLPDIARWAEVVAHMLAPGGFLYLLEGHPFALTLEQREAEGPILSAYDYFPRPEPLVSHDDGSYADPEAKLVNREAHEWDHPLADIVNALIAAGLVLEWLHEHDRLAYPRFKCMEEGADRMFRLPAGRPKLPLAFSLRAHKP